MFALLGVMAPALNRMAMALDVMFPALVEVAATLASAV